MSSGEYFKWAAHDDLCDSEFLGRCVEVLNQNASIILCYPRTKEINEYGKITREYRSMANLSSEKPQKRFYECICVAHPQIQVFGLIRSSILKKTKRIGNYSSSDRVLLGKLALLGRFFEIPEFLFFSRDHPQQHWKIYPNRHSRQVWYDPAKKGKITFPHWKLLLEHFISIKHASLNFNKQIKCYIILVWWMRLNWKHLMANLILKEPVKKSHKSFKKPEITKKEEGR